MADDDEADEGIAFDPTFATAGPRRSTFTPPTGATTPPAEPPSPLDDDALADALAADLTRINPPPPPPFSPPRVEPSAHYSAPDPAVAAEPAVAQPAVMPPSPPPASDMGPPVENPQYPPTPPDSFPPSSAAPDWGAPAPWRSLPAPDPAQAVQLPNPPEHTVYRSLPEDDPTPDDPTPGHSATLDMIERLQAELALRDSGTREFDANPQLGAADPPQPLPPADEPLAAPPVEPGTLNFPSREPEAPPSFINAQDPVSAWPFADPGAAAAPAPAQPAHAQSAPATALAEPAPPPAPAAAEAAQATAESAPAQPSPAPAGTPPWEQPLPAWAPPQPDARVAESPGESPTARVEPPVAQGPPLPAWEVPAPGPNWAPGPEYGIDAEPPGQAQPGPDAQQSVLPSPVAPEGVAWDRQPWDRPAGQADTADAPLPQPEAASPVAPPPLIEPASHGPALLPSEASGRAPLASGVGAPPAVLPVGLAAPVAESPPAPPLIKPGPAPEPDWAAPEPDWAAPTGAPLAPAAGDTLEGPTLEARSVAAAVAADGASPMSAAGSSFDALLAGDETASDEEPQLYLAPEPGNARDAAPEAIFIEPMPVAAGEAVPTDTGSITIIDQAYEEELPDDVDETDRIVPRLGAVSVDTAGIAVVTGAIHPPSGPIATVRVPEDEVVLANNEPVRMKVFSLEVSGLEPTPVDQRVGRAARLFWLWFASNSSIVSLGLGASIFAVGMSLRQSVVSVLAGVALSFIPLGLTTLAGKRSGQPTMVVSRATFGLLGNVIPAILALVTRVFWGAVLLWVLASSVAVVLVGAGLDGGLGDRQLLLISLAIAFLVALLVAFAGYPLFARIQLILSVVSGLLVVGLIAITWKYVDFAAALTTRDGPWVLTISGTVLVFSFVGLVWANSGADLARYQRPGSSGAGSMLWATVGTTLPTFLLISYGALLAASDKGIATGLLASPLDTLGLMLPNWYPVPLLAATGLSLLSGVILTLYSGGFALQSIGLKVRRQWSIVIIAMLLAGLALLLTFGVTGGINELFRDAATTLAVPTAAWAGIFAAETMIRNRRFESKSLLVRGGIYADVRWLNLIALIVISVIGYGLTTATITWLSWEGYGFTLLGMPLDSDLAASDIGVLVALVLGLLVPLIAGVPAIRKQEALRPAG